MNFPFELILIIVFFVLPALGSLFQRLRGGQPPPDEQPQRPQRPQNRPTTRADTSTVTGEATGTEVPRWLEEAQRRVREAQQNETGRSRGRTGPQTSTPAQTARPAQTPRPLVSRQPTPRTQTAQTLEDYRPRAVSLEMPPRDAAAGPTRRPTSARTPAPPLRIQRVGTSKGATLSAYEMRFDKPTLMTGFVWHQILSPPLSQSRRTRLSRRQP